MTWRWWAKPARPAAPPIDVVGLRQWCLAVAINQVQIRNQPAEDAIALAAKYFEILTGVRLPSEAAPVLTLVKGADHGT